MYTNYIDFKINGNINSINRFFTEIHSVCKFNNIKFAIDFPSSYLKKTSDKVITSLGDTIRVFSDKENIHFLIGNERISNLIDILSPLVKMGNVDINKVKKKCCLYRVRYAERDIKLSNDFNFVTYFKKHDNKIIKVPIFFIKEYFYDDIDNNGKLSSFGISSISNKAFIPSF